MLFTGQVIYLFCPGAALLACSLLPLVLVVMVRQLLNERLIEICRIILLLLLFMKRSFIMKKNLIYLFLGLILAMILGCDLFNEGENSQDPIDTTPTIELKVRAL